jgi:hypothetical protein
VVTEINLSTSQHDIPLSGAEGKAPIRVKCPEPCMHFHVLEVLTLLLYKVCGVVCIP